jgi:16S rRNA (cytosine967-C5)-methyltransferase
MPRYTAWRLLRSGSPTPLRDVDAYAAERGLDGRDRGLLRRMMGTEIRRRATLRAILRTYAHGKPSADFAAHLHLALVQALFLDRIPDHALTSETLALVDQTCLPADVRNAKGILRAVLLSRTRGHTGNPRRDLIGRPMALDRDVFHDPVEHPLLWAEDALSIPAQLMKGWVARFGEARARELAISALDEPELSLRAAGASREAVAAELAALGIATRPGTHPRILLAASELAERVIDSAPMAEGRVTIQGESALRAAEAMGAEAGERLLDLCAAPGGKTAVLAAAGASVVACDVDERRLERLRGTLARLGLAERVETRASDGTRSLPEELFDGVLVDAPCTNTGVLAGRPEARWRYGPKARADLVTLQARLLREGAARVRPGGRLVWSTCSLEPDENARQVRAFLETAPEFTLEEEALALPSAPTPPSAHHPQGDADAGPTPADPLVPVVLETPGPESGAGPIDGGYFARLRRYR